MEVLTSSSGEAERPCARAEPPRGRRSSRLGLLVGLLVVAAGALVLASTRGVGPGAAAGLPPGQFPEPGVVHVHGLGVDPADGTLYAATHSGLFRLPAEGGAVRVANRYQDTMGFEVVGPGRFLGSGHPDFREHDNPLLGLVESRDAGRSWTPLSLQGEADFHAIEAAHDRVYAYDSTSETFMVSRDGRGWDRRAQLVLLDIAVSPRDPELVLATTASGLHRSTDGGRSWTAVAGAPGLAVVDWREELLGVGADGAVQASADGGLTWEARGQAGGEPEAMVLAEVDDEEALFVAVSGQGIVQSDDGGRTFQTRYSEP